MRSGGDGLIFTKPRWVSQHIQASPAAYSISLCDDELGIFIDAEFAFHFCAFSSLGRRFSITQISLFDSPETNATRLPSG